MATTATSVKIAGAALIGVAAFMLFDARTERRNEERDRAVVETPEYVQASYKKWIPTWLETMFVDRGAQVDVVDPVGSTFTVSKSTPYTVTCDMGMVYASFSEQQILVFGPGIIESAPALLVSPKSVAADKIAGWVCDATKARLAYIFQ